MAGDTHRHFSEDSRISNRLERETTKPEDIKIILASVEARPEEKDFTDVYSEEEIRMDLVQLIKTKKKFLPSKQVSSERGERDEEITEKDLKEVTEDLRVLYKEPESTPNKERSDAFEATVIKAGGKYGWFGELAAIYQTGEFDDIKRKTDAVIEIFSENFMDEGSEEPRRLALAIDTTVDDRSQVVKEKMRDNLRRVLGALPLTSIKYFESVNQYRGGLQDIIPVVIGVDSDRSNDMLNTYAQLLKLTAAQKDPKRTSRVTQNEVGTLRAVKVKMRTHESQKCFNEEIIIQCNCYKRLLKELLAKIPNNLRIQETLEKVDKLSLEFEKIYKEKREIKRAEQDNIRDEINRVCSTIKLEDVMSDYEIQRLSSKRPAK